MVSSKNLVLRWLACMALLEPNIEASEADAEDTALDVEDSSNTELDSVDRECALKHSHAQKRLSNIRFISCR
jgi:hypothetical protein